MDAIRKKMQSLKGETDSLHATIAKHEADAKEANSAVDQHEIDIRDVGKKIQNYESDFDETTDKLNKVMATYEEREKSFVNAEEEKLLCLAILLAVGDSKKLVALRDVKRRSGFAHAVAHQLAGNFAKLVQSIPDVPENLKAPVAMGATMMNLNLDDPDSILSVVNALLKKQVDSDPLLPPPAKMFIEGMMDLSTDLHTHKLNDTDAVDDRLASLITQVEAEVPAEVRPVLELATKALHGEQLTNKLVGAAFLPLIEKLAPVVIPPSLMNATGIPENARDDAKGLVGDFASMALGINSVDPMTMMSKGMSLFSKMQGSPMF